MTKSKGDANRASEPAGQGSATAGDKARDTQDFVATAATIGVVVAGVALFEVALIPGLVIGGAAVLAPKCLPKYLPKYLPKLRPRLQPMFNATARRPIEPAVPERPDLKLPPAAPAGLGIEQALAKTITFQTIVTTLDFTSNYVVIGELNTAAGLSAFALVVRPLFYLVHETAWNYFGDSVTRDAGQWGPAVELPVVLPLPPDATAPPIGPGRFTINRAVAKTITYRTVATAVDFTATYVVVGELATAVALSAFGFVVGPFVYLGHEMAWDYYGSCRARGLDPPTPKNLTMASA